MLYLDLALEAAARGVAEANIGAVKAAAADTLPAALRVLAASLHNACLALGSNYELVLCLKDLQACTLSGSTNFHVQCHFLTHNLPILTQVNVTNQ